MKVYKLLMFCVFLLAMLSVPVFGSPADDLNNNAVAYYRLENGAFPLEDDVQGLNFTLGTIGVNASAKIDSGHDLETSSSQYITTATSTAWELLNITVSCWFQVESNVDHITIFSTIEDGSGGDADGIQCNVQKDGQDDIQCYTYNNDAVDTWRGSVDVADGTGYHHIVYTFNDSSGDARVYVDGSVQGSETTEAISSIGYDSGLHKFWLGETNLNTGIGWHFDGIVDECYVGSFVADQTHVSFLYQSGSPGVAQQYPFGSQVFSTDVNFTAVDSFNGSSIDSFNVSILWSNGTAEFAGTTNGSIPLLNISDVNLTANITFFNVVGYYNETVLNQVIPANVSTSVQGSLDKFFRVFNFSFGNFTSYVGSNYSRVLNWSVNVSCPDYSSTRLWLFVDGSLNRSVSVSCNNISVLSEGFYFGESEGQKNVSLLVNSSLGSDSVFQYFTFDLNNPVVFLALNYTEGFNNNPVTANLTCRDSVFGNLTYNSSLNGVLLFFGNRSNNTAITNNTVLSDVNNTFVGTCADPFGSSSSSLTRTIYAKSLCLIDERDNTLFDVSNVSSARVYYDDNSTLFDFKSESTNCTNFTSGVNNKLRFELGYSNGDIITRWVDVTLVDSSNVRVCANKEGVSHFEQLIIASSEKPVVMKSVFSDCLVASDYTRFAYQDAYLLKAYTINALYYLYTFVGEVQSLLASVDGSVATYINLDTLEFSKNAYDISVLTDSVAFERTAPDEMFIFYTNLNNDNVNASLTISDVETGTVYLSDVELSTPNNFSMLFNWASLPVDNTTLFKLVVTTVDDEGSTGTLIKYFNTRIQSGYLKSGVGFWIAFLLSIFGLTLTAVRTTFSWFGIAVMLGSIATLAFSVGSWYITMLMGLNFIIIVYIVILMLQKNTATIS